MCPLRLLIRCNVYRLSFFLTTSFFSNSSVCVTESLEHFPMSHSDLSGVGDLGLGRDRKGA
jgi:hypothetical protein